MRKLNKYMMFVFCIISSSLWAESDIITDLVESTLSDVNAKTSMIYFNGRAYNYKPDEKNTLYRSSQSKSISVNDLKVGEKYYFEVKSREITSANGFVVKPIVVTYISDERPPE